MHSLPPILVIEDDPVIGRALCRALQALGQRYDYVGNCAACAELEGPYSTAIIDIHLPDGNGLDLFEELFSKGTVGSAVFFSATTVELEVVRAVELGTLIHKSQGVALAIEIAIKIATDYEAPESATRASTPQMPAARLTPTEATKAQ